MSDVQQAADLIEDRAGKTPPDLAIVLGSGLGELADRITEPVRISYTDLPGFPKSGVTGHAGALISGYLNEARVAVLAGRSHYYEHGNPRAMHAPIATLAAIGCPVLALSNAAGSTRENMPPGSLMMLSDHLNWSGLNPLIGMEGDDRFVDLSLAYDPALCATLQGVAQDQKQTLRSGVYAWFSGPSFETPAEINAIRMLGADAVGMSTVPEVLLARYHGIRAAAVSVITNFAAGMPGAAIGHDHTKLEADKAKEGFIGLYTGFAGELARGQGE